jgi:hypothetical protein
VFHFNSVEYARVYGKVQATLRERIQLNTPSFMPKFELPKFQASYTRSMLGTEDQEAERHPPGRRSDAVTIQ